MTGAGRQAIPLLAAALAVVPIAAQQQFRSGAEGVSIHASVKRGDRAVTDLEADAFEVFDNGVRQRIVSLDSAMLPLDVTVVLDLSTNDGSSLDDMKSALVELAADLTPEDRFRVLAVTHAVREVIPWTAGGARGIRPDLMGAGAAAVYDALSIALGGVETVDRWPVVMAMTDGCDTLSVTTPARLMDIVRRSGAVLYTLRPEAPRHAPDEAPAGVVAPGVLGRLGTVTDTSQALIDDIVRRRDAIGVAETDGRGRCSEADLEAIGEVSGGRTLRLRPGSSSRNALADALEDQRSSYLLRYEPLGVEPGGWHDVVVQLVEPGDFDVRWRRGYYGSPSLSVQVGATSKPR